MKLTNNAQRLADHLLRFRIYSDDVKLKSIWAQEFGIDINALDKIAMIPAKLISMTYKIESGISGLSNLNRKDLYISYAEEARKLLFNLTTIHNASNVKAMFPQSIIDNLYIISDILNSNNLNEKELPDDKFSGLTEKINELIDEISESDLSIEDKDFLLKLASIIKDSISEYLIDGVSSLREAVELSIGMMIRENLSLPNTVPQNKTTFYKKLMDIVKDVNAIYAIAVNTKAVLPEAFEKIKGLLQ